MDKEIKTVRQHFVPQFYLKYFTDNAGILQIYDRKISDYIEKRPKNICFEKLLYETPLEYANPQLGKYVLPNKTENSFSMQESRYSTLLKKITAICTDPANKKALICHREEKEILAAFTMNMFLRNPWFVHQTNATIPEDIMKNPDLQSIDQVLQKSKCGGTKSLIQAAYSALLLDSEFNQGENVPAILARKLTDMYMCFLTCDSFFITGSLPVYFAGCDSEDDLPRPQYVYIPLSPKTALLYSCEEGMKPYHNRIRTVSEETAISINQTYLKKSAEQCRYIISHSRDILIKTLTPTIP